MNETEDRIVEMLHNNPRLAEAVGEMTNNAQALQDSYFTVLRICELNQLESEHFTDMLWGRFDITMGEIDD